MSWRVAREILIAVTYLPELSNPIALHILQVGGFLTCKEQDGRGGVAWVANSTLSYRHLLMMKRWWDVERIYATNALLFKLTNICHHCMIQLAFNLGRLWLCHIGDDETKSFFRKVGVRFHYLDIMLYVTLESTASLFYKPQLGVTVALGEVAGRVNQFGGGSAFDPVSIRSAWKFWKLVLSKD